MPWFLLMSFTLADLEVLTMNKSFMIDP
jgi:hypothetical protein